MGPEGLVRARFAGAARGCDPGGSGWPKGLVLNRLDQFIFGEWLAANSGENLALSVLASCSIRYWLDPVHNMASAPAHRHSRLVRQALQTPPPSHGAPVEPGRVVAEPHWVKTLPNAKLPDRPDFRLSLQ